MADVDEMLRRWAESKYVLAAGSVAQVTFAFTEDPSYSEYTPGAGPGLEVTVRGRDGAVLREEDVFDADLIREVLAFAVDHG